MKAARLVAVLIGFAVFATFTVTPANGAQDEARWTKEQNFSGYRARVDIVEGQDSPVVTVRVSNPMDYAQQLQMRGLLGQTDPKLCFNTSNCDAQRATFSDQEPVLAPRSEMLIQIVANPPDTAGLVELFVEPTPTSTAYDLAFVTVQILLSMAGCNAAQQLKALTARVAFLLAPEFAEIANRFITLGAAALADIPALLPRVVDVLKAQVFMLKLSVPVGCIRQYLQKTGSGAGVVANSWFMISWGLKSIPLAVLAGKYLEVGFFADDVATVLRLSYNPPPDTRIPATVTWVEDGDTICVQLDRPPPPGTLSDRCNEPDAPPGIDDWPVRLIGIDAPEILPTADDCYGQQATDQLRALVEGKQVMLELDPGQQVDDTTYRRILAYVWLDDQLVNDQMVRQGYAREVHSFPDTGDVLTVKYHDRLVEAETQARTTKQGLWTACTTTPEPPTTLTTTTKPITSTSPRITGSTPETTNTPTPTVPPSTSSTTASPTTLGDKPLLGSEPPVGSVAMCGYAHAESLTDRRVVGASSTVSAPPGFGATEGVRVALRNPALIGEFEEYWSWLAEVSMVDGGVTVQMDAFAVSGLNGPNDPPSTTIAAHDLTGDGVDDITICVSAEQGNWWLTSIVVLTNHNGSWEVRIREVVGPESSPRGDGWLSSLGGGVIEVGDTGEFYAGQCRRFDVTRYRWSQNQFISMGDSVRWTWDPGVQCP